MKTDIFFDAMELIDERYKADAMKSRRVLSYTAETVKENNMNGRTRRNYRRFIALAAAVSVLLALGIAAYATGWFGLRGLEMGKDHGRSIISLQGLNDTPEAKASAEWKEYWDKLEAENALMDGFDYAESQELFKTYGAYDCYTKAQAKVLQGIAEKYSLRLLSGVTIPEGEKAYYEAAGTGRLLAVGGDYYNEFFSGYVYDDGSFKFEGELHGDMNYAIPYSMIRSVKGTMTTLYTSVEDIDSFEDWKYTAADGTQVNLSNAESGSFIIYDSGDAFVIVHFSHESWADNNGDGKRDGIGDKAISFTIQNRELEKIADCFSFSALTDPTLDMDKPFTEYARKSANAADMIMLSDDIDLSMVDERSLYYVKLAIEESIAPYIGNFELVDFFVAPLVMRTMGWIEFTGVPKEELDWDCVCINGKNLYCRSLNLIDPDNSGQWHMDTPFDMQPYHPLSNHGEGDIYYGFENEEKLRNIAAASLYVPETGETYTLSTAQELETLTKMLDHGSITFSNGCLGWNPLYLTFKDGSRATAFTNSDGSNYVNIFGYGSTFGLGMSIYELFNVPLEAAGYSRNGDIVTAHSTDPGDMFKDAWHETDYPVGGLPLVRRVHTHSYTGEDTRESRPEYDDEGRIICYKWYGADGSLEVVETYEYNQLGQLSYTERVSHGRRSSWCSYIYDEQGRCIREEHDDNDNPPNYTGGWIYYDYDIDGTCRRTHGFEK